MATAPRSNNEVTVFCRLPHGLELSVFDTKEVNHRAALSAAKTPDFSLFRGVRTHVINGARRDARYHPKDNVLLGMAGRTSVPKDFWDAWVEQNKDSDFIKKNLIFAEATERDGAARQAEMATERMGLEGIDPEGKIGAPNVTKEIEG